MVNTPTRGFASVMTQVHRVTDDLEKPALDDRSYRVIKLPNKLEVLLVHDPDTDKASASLNVNVGSFSDEDDMPGMAHAVEHALFMGTKKVYSSRCVIQAPALLSVMFLWNSLIDFFSN
jgi:insulysin